MNKNNNKNKMDTKGLKECEICGDDKDVNRHYGVVACKLNTYFLKVKRLLFNC
jgi:ribosomal protein S14